MTSRNETVKCGLFDGISDHHGIYLELKRMEELKTEIITVRSYKHYNGEDLKNDYQDEIAKSNFATLIEQKRLNEAMEAWTNTVTLLCDKHAPEKTVKIRSETKEIPWYTTEIISVQCEKNALLSEHRKTKDKNLKNILKTITNKLKYLKQKTRKQFFVPRQDKGTRK